MSAETKGQTVGERIRMVRGDVRQPDFATRLGVDKNTIGRYERDERQPDAEFLAKLCALGYSGHWLVTGEGPQMASAPLLEPKIESVNAGALAGAITAVEELLRARQATLPPEKKGEMIALVYKQLTDVVAKGQIPGEILKDLLNQAS
ncbi:phage repressor [Paramagnetospirillum caucaseum]|uniref:Phage repressor n=1 Tax=Paramagnetospirillum caucaseum TaxID=1244869 RepID=M3AB68_9PROT|nr:helix-turn-helix transcriptional regulator [Paramagnetospirillum caucaseum]EME69754.1 phage repressor [Paramagnetospirillum caucaseum]